MHLHEAACQGSVGRRKMTVFLYCEPCKGSPIKALVNKKKAVHPRFFLRVCRARWSVRSQSQFVPEISWSDSGPAIEAIRSVTHPVLALRRATLRTERNPRVAPAGFPPARFLGQPLLMPVARQCQVAPRVPTSAMAEARKYSVPARVHSVHKNSGWSRGNAASNPSRTHGTVESPAAVCSWRNICLRERRRLQSVLRVLPTPLLAGGDAPKIMGSALALPRGTSAGDHRRCGRGSHARPPWPACTPAPWKGGHQLEIAGQLLTFEPLTVLINDANHKIIAMQVDSCH